VLPKLETGERQPVNTSMCTVAQKSNGVVGFAIVRQRIEFKLAMLVFRMDAGVGRDAIKPGGSRSSI